jgi:hypothetical protein
MKDAVLAGVYRDGGLLSAWSAIEGAFTPNTVPAWHSDKALDACAAWLSDHPRGVCWTEHVHFGERLAKIAKVPYFGAQGLDANGGFILERKGPCIASIDANSTGRNMQFNWHEMLVTACPQSPVDVEQMLARVHRPGQTRAVTTWVWIGCHELIAGVHLAIQGATAIREREGAAQRILYADVALPSMAEIGRRGGYRWTK